MGLGKTLQILALIWTLLKQGPQVGGPAGFMAQAESGLAASPQLGCIAGRHSTSCPAAHSCCTLAILPRLQLPLL
jgi:hypothetical protein